MQINPEAVLDRIVADRLPRNEQAATYRIPGVCRVQLGRPSERPGLYASPGPSVWVNGRYLGELSGVSPHQVENLILPGELVVEGRFRHLGFEIERIDGAHNPTL